MVGLPTTTWMAAGLAFLAVAFVTVALIVVVEWVQERRRQRDVLRQLRAFTQGDIDTGPGGLLRSSRGAAPSWLEPLAARVPALGDLQLMIEQAGMSMSLARFILLTAGEKLAFG